MLGVIVAILVQYPAHAQLAAPIAIPPAATISGSGPASTAVPRNGNGALADDRSFPFVVALLNGSGGVVCSGTLLNRHGQILTAAHCFCDPSSRPTRVRIGRSVHAADRAAVDELTLQREISDTVAFLDEDYCAKKGVDLAVVATRTPLDASVDLVADLHVASPKTPHPDPKFAKYPLAAYIQSFRSNDPVPVFTVGFGASEVQTLGGGAKRFAQIDLLPCQLNRSECTTLLEFYAPSAQGAAVETCRGDSGGPVLEREDGAGQPPRWRLFGVTSRSLSDNREKYCGGGGVYVSVLSPRVQNWLAQFLEAR
jgi:secreted trypsin-like serine protease